MANILKLSIAVVALAIASCATTPNDTLGIDVRFVISARKIVDGRTDARTYENGVLMRLGNSFERDLDNQFRVRLLPQVKDGTALVEFEFRDLRAGGVVVGAGTATVPVGGATDIDLAELDGRKYHVHFVVHRRELPKSA